MQVSWHKMFLFSIFVNKILHIDVIYSIHNTLFFPKTFSPKRKFSPSMGRFKKKKKKLMEFSIKGSDPASQHLNEKKIK